MPPSGPEIRDAGGGEEPVVERRAEDGSAGVEDDVDEANELMPEVERDGQGYDVADTKEGSWSAESPGQVGEPG